MNKLERINYTKAYYKQDLHNLLHFLSLRMEKYAQYEIRQYANIIGTEIVAKLFPMTWNAFLDYRLNGVTLTARDIEMINLIQTGFWDGKNMVNDFGFDDFGWFNKRDDGTLKSNLERQEFEDKCKQLGINVPWMV